MFASLPGSILPYLAVICFVATLTRSVIATMAAYLFIVIAALTFAQVLASRGAGSSPFAKVLLPSELYKMLLAWSTDLPVVLNPLVVSGILLVLTGVLVALAIETFRHQDLPAF